VSDLLSLRETAERLGMSESWVRKAVATDRLPVPVVRLGGRLKVGARALDEWVAQATGTSGGTEG
jgi:excisionase family DNA binding protein